MTQEQLDHIPLMLLRRYFAGLSREFAIRQLNIAFISELASLGGRLADLHSSNSTVVGGISWAGNTNSVRLSSSSSSSRSSRSDDSSSNSVSPSSPGSSPSSNAALPSLAATLNGVAGPAAEAHAAKESALRSWLQATVGLAEWDLQALLPTLESELSRWRLPQLQEWYQELRSSQGLGQREQLASLVRQHPRLLLPSCCAPGSHLPPGALERRRWYPRSMLEALELHAGGLPAALRALARTPALAKLQPVVFAELARRLEALGCSPEEVWAVAVARPEIFGARCSQRGALKYKPTLWDKLEYLVKALGHRPVVLLTSRLPLLKRVRLGEAQKRAAFLELRGDDRHKRHLNWARQNTKDFCKQVGCPEEEYKAFKASIGQQPGAKSGPGWRRSSSRSGSRSGSSSSSSTAQRDVGK